MLALIVKAVYQLFHKMIEIIIRIVYILIFKQIVLLYILFFKLQLLSKLENRIGYTDFVDRVLNYSALLQPNRSFKLPSQKSVFWLSTICYPRIFPIRSLQFDFSSFIFGVGTRYVSDFSLFVSNIQVLSC